MNWNVWTYDLLLDRPRVFGHERVVRRTGVLVDLRDASGMWWLEMGPVTVFDGPDQADLARWCGVWAEHWSRRMPVSSIRDLMREAGCPEPVLETLASTWFLGLSARRVLLRGIRKRVWLTALLELADSDLTDLRRQTGYLADAGFRYVKIKVRGIDPDGAVKALHVIRSTLGAGCQVRVDVNASWSLDALELLTREALLPQLDMAPVAYIEDPFPEDCADTRWSWPVPLAVDTTALLRQTQQLAADEKPQFQWGVWKPFVSWPIRSKMANGGMSIVVSSSCESDVGTAALAVLSLRRHLASGLGLGSYRWLAEHVVTRRLPLADRPWVELGDLLKLSQDIASERLTRCCNS